MAEWIWQSSKNGLTVHFAPGVPHDAANRQKVARLIADRMERVAKAVEIPVAIDAQRVEQLAKLMRQRSILSPVKPTSEFVSGEQQLRVGVILRQRPHGEPVTDRFDGFWP